MTARGGKTPLSVAPEPADLPAEVTIAPPAAPARPRQVTRGRLITVGGGVTALLAWRFASGHHPGRTLAGHAFWFIVWDLVLTALILWAWTGFRHRAYRERASRRYYRARARGGAWAEGARQRWADYADRPRGPGPSDPVADDGQWPAVADRPGARPAGPRHARRPRSASRDSGGKGLAPAAWRHSAQLLTDVDGEKGPEVLARILGAAAGIALVAEAFDDLHHHLTVDRGYDERAMPSLAAAQTDLGEAAAVLANIHPEITEFYGYLFDAADEGKRAPHDGREMEED